MINGEIPFKEKFCILDGDDDKKTNSYDAKSKIKIISPTQSSVEQARSEIRDEKDINKNEELDFNQIRGSAKSGKKKKTKPKAKQAKPKKKSKTKGSVKKAKNKKNYQQNVKRRKLKRLVQDGYHSKLISLISGSIYRKLYSKRILGRVQSYGNYFRTKCYRI